MLICIILAFSKCLMVQEVVVVYSPYIQTVLTNLTSFHGFVSFTMEEPNYGVVSVALHSLRYKKDIKQPCCIG